MEGFYHMKKGEGQQSASNLLAGISTLSDDNSAWVYDFSPYNILSIIFQVHAGQSFFFALSYMFVRVIKLFMVIMKVFMWYSCYINI